MFDFTVGQRASLERSFTAGEVRGFVELVGGPDDGDAVPSGLIGGLFSQLLGTTLPGRGTNWMKQSLRFHRRARLGQTVCASVEIIRVRPEKQLVNLATRCQTSEGTLICEGEALVLAREMFIER